MDGAIQFSFNPNQIRSSSSSYKTCFTGRALALANSTDISDFVAVEIRGNQNKAYMICMVEATPTLVNRELVMTAKELFPVTPGSLLFALSQESLTFQASDVVAGKVAMTVISNDSRPQSGTVTTRYRLEHDDLDRILRSVGIPDEVSA